jgi:hypothetical protein
MVLGFLEGLMLAAMFFEAPRLVKPSQLAETFGTTRGNVEADLVEHALHDGVQAARADVLGRLVDRKANCAISSRAPRGELELQAFGLEQRRVLLGQRRLGLGEDAQEVVDGQRLQLDADGEAALQLGESGRWASRRGTRRRR